MKKATFWILSLILFSLQAQAQDIYDAARKGDLETIKALFEKDPNSINTSNSQDYTPLILACYYNQLEVVKYLVENKVKLNESQGSATALQAVCYKGFKEIAEVLLDYGSDPNIYDANGTSPLIYATQFKHIEIIGLLLKKGANKNYVDPSGNSAVDYAEKLQIQETLDLFKD